MHKEIVDSLTNHAVKSVIKMILSDARIEKLEPGEQNIIIFNVCSGVANNLLNTGMESLSHNEKLGVVTHYKKLFSKIKRELTNGN